MMLAQIRLHHVLSALASLSVCLHGFRCKPGRHAEAHRVCSPH